MRYAIFVDAGYVFKVLQRRANVSSRLALPYLVQNIVDVIARSCKLHAGGKELLRIYWYDGLPQTGPTSSHRAIGELPNLKMRYGTLNSQGQQKQVDSLIITDLLALAQNRAIVDAFLISGDADLQVGVDQAQRHGVRVFLGGISDSQPNVSSVLRQEADFVFDVDVSSLRPNRPQISIESTDGSMQHTTQSRDNALSFLSPTDSLHTKPTPSSETENVIREAIIKIVQRLGSEPSTILPAPAPLPPEIDRELLNTLKKVLGRSLAENEKRSARGFFREKWTEK